MAAVLSEGEGFDPTVAQYEITDPTVKSIILNELNKVEGHPIPISEEEDLDDEKYSMWMDYGKDFVPAISLQVKDSLPSGVYKLHEERDGIHFMPSKISTDELYNFSESINTNILKEIKDFWNRADIYKQHGVLHKRGLLLEGPPGGGKSACITLLINDLLQNNGLVFLVNSIKDFELIYDSLSGIVRKIEPTRPIITIIEDIDKLIDAINTEAPLLDFLDGKVSINHHLVIMTSNNTSDLSSALLRPSRIDMRFVIEAPNANIRKEFFLKKGISEENVDEYVKKTEGFTFAQMKEVFIGTIILGKSLDRVISQILNPEDTKDYLSKNTKKVGL